MESTASHNQLDLFWKILAIQDLDTPHQDIQLMNNFYPFYNSSTPAEANKNLPVAA